MKTEQIQWTASTGWMPDTSTGSLGDAAQVVFAFGNLAAITDSGSLELARRLYPKSHIVGCTTSGEIKGATMLQQSVCLTAVAFGHTTVLTARASIPTVSQSYQAGIELARALPAAGLTAVFVLSEGLQVRGSQLVRGIGSVLPPEVVVCGGFASDGDRGRESLVWCDGKPVQGTAIAIGFYGDRLRVNCGISGAWGPFGPNRLVTKACGNILYELDGRPALSLYKLYLAEHAASLPASALLFPMMVRGHTSQREVLRALLSVNEQDQSVTLAGDIEEGSYARLMRGSIERLIESTVETARSTVTGQCPVGLAMVVSCYGRQKVLNQRTDEELEAVSQALNRETAIAGFYSYGEIGPLAAGQSPELHNETMVITTFGEV